MITCIMMLRCERQKINEVAAQVAEIAGVSEVYSVSGQYDLVCILKVMTIEALSTLVTQQLANVSGITRTETMLSLRAYAKQDLDAMFDIGGG